jgi:hypothetical protein
MAQVTLYGTRIMEGLVNTTPPALADPGEGGGEVLSWTETVSAGAADSTGSLYVMARLPSNARLLGQSTINWDQLGSTTAKLDVGVYKTSSKQSMTDDPDAINDGLVVSSAGSAALVKDHANYGKRLWEYINGQTVDPGGQLDVKIALTDAHLSSGAGDISVSIQYTR